MNILDRHIGLRVLVATTLGVVVLSGFLAAGHLFRELLDLAINHGMDWRAALSFLGHVLPFTLAFTIPWGFVTALLLVFGRMSADGELIAVRAAGVSLLRTCAPIWVLAVVLSGLCLWISVDVAPRAQRSMFSLLAEVARQDVMVLFPAGTVIEHFPGRRIYAEEKDGHVLRNVMIYEISEADGVPTRLIQAREARITLDGEGRNLHVGLKEARFQTRSPEAPSYPASIQQPILMGEGTYVLSPRALTEPLRRSQSLSALSLEDLDLLMRGKTQTGGESALRAKMEYQRRFSVACASAAFALVAVPLGIVAHRRETIVGFGMGIAMAFTYYFFVIIAQTLARDGNEYSVWIVWLPNVAFALLGAFMLARQDLR